MKLNKFLIIFSVAGIVITGLYANNYFEKEHLSLSESENSFRWLKGKPEITQLRSGDLIFRHGRGFISNALMSFSRREKKYSHAGIVSVENGNVFVYHAIGGEENISNKLRKDPLEMFCNPADVHAFGIYRTDLSTEKVQSILQLAAMYYARGLEFDTKFDLATDDKMYCTEFIYKVFRQVLGSQNYISLSALPGRDFIACDDLYCNNHCRLIYSYHY